MSFFVAFGMFFVVWSQIFTQRHAARVSVLHAHTGALVAYVCRYGIAALMLLLCVLALFATASADSSSLLLGVGVDYVFAGLSGALGGLVCVLLNMLTRVLRLYGVK